jgi:hypothetical protein
MDVTDVCLDGYDCVPDSFCTEVLIKIALNTLGSVSPVAMAKPPSSESGFVLCCLWDCVLT